MNKQTTHQLTNLLAFHLLKIEELIKADSDGFDGFFEFKESQLSYHRDHIAVIDELLAWREAFGKLALAAL